MMQAEEVLRIHDCLCAVGVQTWLDGGWGVDALLGEQTRAHEDLDLVLALNDVDRAAAALGPLGYAPSADERPTRIVFAAPDKRQIDIHIVAFDAEGGGVQQLPKGRSYRYPPEGFNAQGTVDGRQVRCLSAEVQLACHLGYQPTEKDRRDVLLLAARFRLPLRSPYRRRG